MTWSRSLWCSHLFSSSFQRNAQSPLAVSPRPHYFCHSKFFPDHFYIFSLSLAFLSFLNIFGFDTQDLKCIEVGDQMGEQ